MGFKLICEKCAYLHSALCHAERGETTCMLGGSGACSLKKIFLNGAICMRSGVYFATIL